MDNMTCLYQLQSSEKFSENDRASAKNHSNYDSVVLPTELQWICSVDFCMSAFVGSRVPSGSLAPLAGISVTDRFIVIRSQ